MNVPLPPILDEQYGIPLNAGTVSIDALVANILSHATQFPVRQTGNAQQVGEALYAELPRAGVSLQAAVNFDIAIALSVILLLLTFAINFFLTRVQQREPLRWPRPS